MSEMNNPAMNAYSQLANMHAQTFNAAARPQWEAWSASQSVNSWSTPLPRPPGIYWTRTGGKTHTVEVVR